MQLGHTSSNAAGIGQPLGHTLSVTSTSGERPPSKDTPPLAATSSAVQAAQEEFRLFLEAKEGSSLRGWLKHFDTANEQRVTSHEFQRAAVSLGFPGNSLALFRTLDSDGSGELSLDEIDPDQDSLWKQFRQWCTVTFSDARNMAARLTNSDVGPGYIAREDFRKIRSNGWEHGHADLLFSCLDLNDAGYISEEQLKWLEVEKKRQLRKDQARERSLQEAKLRAQGNAEARGLLRRFRRFLVKRHGNLVRAWRDALSPNDSMVLPKAQFFKAVCRMHFRCDVRLLWQAFGKEDVISMDDMDVKSAVAFAHFKTFVTRSFKTGSEAFLALDRTGSRTIKQREFVRAMLDAGYRFDHKLLFDGLDRHAKKYLVEEDFFFLDKWKPVPYLTAYPNKSAMEQVKALLFERYGSYLKAWRRIIDLDNSNRCDWKEFKTACAKMGFHGDVAGAWRALDTDHTGYITLKEVDPVSSEVLESFRHWACTEFGSVFRAFGVFDSDGSDNVTSREFCRACRVYGYEGNARALYKALDVERDGALSMREVIFLDEWASADDQNLEDEDAEPVASKRLGSWAVRAIPSQEEIDQTDGNAEGDASALPQVPSIRFPRREPPPEPTRVWWTDLPCKQVLRPPTGRGSAIPRMWCALCKARGPCRHLSPGPCERRARSATPSGALWPEGGLTPLLEGLPSPSPRAALVRSRAAAATAAATAAALAEANATLRSIASHAGSDEGLTTPKVAVGPPLISAVGGGSKPRPSTSEGRGPGTRVPVPPDDEKPAKGRPSWRPGTSMGFTRTPGTSVGFETAPALPLPSLVNSPSPDKDTADTCDAPAQAQEAGDGYGSGSESSALAGAGRASVNFAVPAAGSSPNKKTPTVFMPALQMSDAEVQLLALTRFPMGTVSPVVRSPFASSLFHDMDLKEEDGE